MIAVVQRVKSAKVIVENATVSSVGKGLLTLLGVKKGDTEAHLTKLVQKIINLRIFEDDAGKMNLSVKDVGGSHLIVSQFTLLADCRKGNRPSFTEAEAPAEANALYEKALTLSHSLGVETLGGKFGAHMMIDLINDGPVTILLDTEKL